MTTQINKHTHITINKDSDCSNNNNGCEANKTSKTSTIGNTNKANTQIARTIQIMQTRHNRDRHIQTEQIKQIISKANQTH